MIQALFVPVLILILELCILFPFLLILNIVQILPPVQVAMNLVDQLMSNFHPDLELLLVVDAVFERNVYHAHHLGKSKEGVPLVILAKVGIVNHVVLDVVAYFR